MAKPQYNPFRILTTLIDELSYLSDLQAKIARLESHQVSGTPSNSSAPRATSPSRDLRDTERDARGPDDRADHTSRSSQDRTRDSSPGQGEGANLEERELINPLTEAPTFMSSSRGKTCKSAVRHANLMNNILLILSLGQSTSAHHQIGRSMAKF
jgi:hypothetical protein